MQSTQGFSAGVIAPIICLIMLVFFRFNIRLRPLIITDIIILIILLLSVALKIISIEFALLFAMVVIGGTFVFKLFCREIIFDDDSIALIFLTIACLMFLLVSLIKPIRNYVINIFAGQGVYTAIYISLHFIVFAYVVIWGATAIRRIIKKKK